MELTKKELALRARAIWQHARRGGGLIDQDRSVMRDAYWSGCLPKDEVYSVGQWVEDGFPSLP